MTVGERQSIKTSRQINFTLYQIRVSVLEKKKVHKEEEVCVLEGRCYCFIHGM